MRSPSFDRMWETHLCLRLDVNPAKSRGAAAPVAAMRAIRSEVLPLVRCLQQGSMIEWFSFLVHAAPEGAAPGAYVHLRLSFMPYITAYEINNVVCGPWLPPTRVVAPACREISGLDRSAFRGKSIHRAWKLIGEQSAWVLDFVEAHPAASDMALVLHAVQFAHYTNNMMQLPDAVPDWYRRAAFAYGKQYGVAELKKKTAKKRKKRA